MMKKDMNNAIILGVIGLMVLLSAYSALAVNIPGILNEVSTSTRTIDGTNKTDEALAGNVTELLIDDTRVTDGWQGYYGNISGTIVLDDALNNSMFTWALDSTTGEIYASRNYSIDWSTGQVVCANVGNVSIENAALFPGIASNDADNFTNTFAEATHPAFSAGVNAFTANQCSYTVSTYVDDAVDTSRSFNETLLYSKSHNGIIYAALINGNTDGFKSGTETYDFQMLVGEDGHSEDTATTTYYFYVELDA